MMKAVRGATTDNGPVTDEMHRVGNFHGHAEVLLDQDDSETRLLLDRDQTLRWISSGARPSDGLSRDNADRHCSWSATRHFRN
jgi:ribosomal protein S16